jgi:MoaA/NifB/PqqE/SkfB family radical SAM enzyme
MPLELFSKFVQDMQCFPDKLKTLHFSGLGEPLLNTNLHEMIALAKLVAKEVVLVSNGSLLTEELSEKLIDAGLDVFRCSLQGLNEADYYKTAGARIDFDQFVAQIKYLYEKRKCKVYIKAPDICISDEDKILKLHQIFDGISDGIIIQTIFPIRAGIKINKEKNKTIDNRDIRDISVCSQPFFTLLLSADGNICPCCALDVDYDQRLTVGNIHSEQMLDIWNSQKMQSIRMNHLKKQKDVYPQCKNCKTIIYSNDNNYDNIDDAAELLITKYMREYNL